MGTQLYSLFSDIIVFLFIYHLNSSRFFVTYFKNSKKMSLFFDFYSSLFILLCFIHHFLTLSSSYSSIIFIHHVSLLRISKIRRKCHYFAIFIHLYSSYSALFIIF